jgi:dipeptide/tripeptide permease
MSKAATAANKGGADEARDPAPKKDEKLAVVTTDYDSEASLPVKAHDNGEIKSVILQINLFILVTELCERLAYYGLTGSLVVFFSKVYKLPTALSTELNTLFGAINYITPLLGAFIADKYLGRFKTIAIFCSLYVVGMVMCVLGAIPSWASFGQYIFFIGLFGGVAMGSGGIKPNVVVLGADQFDLTTEAGRIEKDRFFNYFYWCINIGSAFAFGALTNLSTNGAPSLGIPEDWGFFWSFLIPAVAMALAVVILFAGAKRVRCCGRCAMGGYKHVKPQSSALATFLTMFGRAASQTPSGRSIISACVAILLGFVATIASYFIPQAASSETGVLTIDGHFVAAVVGMVLLLYACIIFIVVGGRAQWMHAGYRLWAEKQAELEAKKTGGDDAAAAALVAERGGRFLSYGATGTPADSSATSSHRAHDDSVVDLDALSGHDGNSSNNSKAAASPLDPNDPDQFKSMDLSSSDPLADLKDNTALLDACELVRLLPYFAYMVVFWAVYNQMSSNFVVQGCQMNLFWTGDPSSGTAQVPSAFLNLFDTVVIIVFVPIFDAGVYPLIARCRQKGALTVLEKVGSGFFFCALAMISAGVVEILRKQSGTYYVDPCCSAGSNTTELDLCCAGNATCAGSCAYNSNCAADGSIEYMSDLTVWCQSLQYLLIGIAEILTSVSSYELFYTQVPESMRSTCQALNLLTTSIGCMVAGGINSVFQFWIPNNLNDGKLENVYFVIGAMALFALVGYVFTSQTFVYSDQLRDDLLIADPLVQVILQRAEWSLHGDRAHVHDARACPNNAGSSSAGCAMCGRAWFNVFVSLSAATSFALRRTHCRLTPLTQPAGGGRCHARRGRRRRRRRSGRRPGRLDVDGPRHRPRWSRLPRWFHQRPPQRECRRRRRVRLRRRRGWRGAGGRPQLLVQPQQQRQLRRAGRIG